MKIARRSSGRWLLLIALVLLAVIVWQTGLIDQLSFETLKARQAELAAWTDAHPWQAAGLFFRLIAESCG